MAKIDFGYNNDYGLSPTRFEGAKWTADFVGVVNIKGSNILITNLNGNFRVDEILQDIYADGSYVTYANELTRPIVASLLNTLNLPHVNEKIQKGLPIIDVLKELGIEAKPSKLSPVVPYEDVPGIITVVSSELFEDLRDSKMFNLSIYKMSKEIEMLTAQIEELQQSKGL